MKSQYRSSREAGMWRLLKTEFEYDRFVLGICFSLVTIISFVFLILGGSDLEKSIPAYRAVLICSAAIVWLNSLVKLQNEKRECIQMRIPVGIRTIGLSRLIYLCVFWIIIAGLFFIMNWIVKGHTLDLTDVTAIFSMTGIVFTANAFTLLQKDLRYFYTGKHAKLCLYSICNVFRGETVLRFLEDGNAVAFLLGMGRCCPDGIGNWFFLHGSMGVQKSKNVSGVVTG
jgi:hypothetical protein